MKALVILLILAAVVSLAYLCALWIQQKAKARTVEHGEWSVHERSLPGRQYGVFLIKPGEKAQLFGEPISQRLPEYEFEEILAERRVGAESRANTLNRRLNP